MLHSAMQPGDGIHPIYNWAVADAATRVALVLTTLDIGKVAYQLDTKKFWVLENNTGPVWNELAHVYTTANLVLTDGASYYTVRDLETVLAVLGKAYHKHVIALAASDETTAITVGTGKTTFRMPCAMVIESVKASLTTAQATGATLFTIDVKKNGTTIFTTKPTFDNTIKTTATAATASVLDATKVSCADDEEITIDVTALGDGTAKGLKVYVIGRIV